MKYCFILNPAAGKGKKYKDLIPDIKKACEDRGAEYDVYITESVGDGEAYARRFCESNRGETLRIYACGGDGTLCEVVNGAVGFANASVGVVPVGTGNDFVRNFSPKEKFFDIGAQLDGEAVALDLIKANDRYCVNTLNIGFDCEVVVRMGKIKKSPLIPSKLAYIGGLVVTLVDLPGVDIEVSFDGGNTVEKRSFLLSSIANGRFCGGGFKSNPIAALNDGLMYICLIKPVTRRKFLSLVSSYKNGTHLENEKAKSIIDYIQCASVDYYFGKMHNIGIDGEVSQAESLHIEVARGALNFIVPKGMLADSVAPEKAVAPECEIAYTE
jgi:YegS/Rv2252/BmrU family lipid kinase